MAEGGGLLNRYTLLRRIEGSNPSVSAKINDLFLEWMLQKKAFLPLFAVILQWSNRGVAMPKVPGERTVKGDCAECGRGKLAKVKASHDWSASNDDMTVWETHRGWTWSQRSRTGPAIPLAAGPNGSQS